MRFLAESGALLSGSAELAQGRQSPGVQGRHSPQSGLAALLAGSGLQAERQADGSYVLRPAPAQPAAQARRATQAQTLPAVTVQAAPESATGPVLGYAARRSATATKTDTPLLETPQSISVIGRAELEDRGALSVMDAVRYSPGVSTEVYGPDARGFDWAHVRGFLVVNDGQFLDGLRTTHGYFANQRVDPYGLERVEVLRGPAGTMYGKGDAGGLINRVSKRPQAEAVREVEVQLGNQRRRQLAFDVGGKADAQGKLLYRLVGVGMGTDYPERYASGEHVRNQRLYLAPSLTWQPHADTSFTLSTELLRDRNKGFAFPHTPRGRSVWNPDEALLMGEPDFSGFDHDQASIGYQLQHRFSPAWSLHQNLRYASVDAEFRRINEDEMQPDGRTLTRWVNLFREKSQQLGMDTHLQGRMHTGGVSHQLLLGLDAEWQRLRERTHNGSAPPLDVDNPRYGQGPVTVSPEPDDTHNNERRRQLGLYVQDQMRLSPQWLLTVGGRMDWVRQHQRDLLAGSHQSQRDRQFSGRLGLNWLLPSGWTPYFSYAESFKPEIGTDAQGRAFKPTRGKLYELGVKYAPEGGRQLFTAALYDLRKTNVLTTDLDNPDHNKQTGAVRSRGIELEAKAALSRQWEVLANYTYNDLKITHSNDGDIGKVPTFVPRQTASAWLNWRAPQGTFSGLGAGLGVRHVGSTYNDAANTWKNPSATFIDASLSYERGPWRMALSVNNLADKVHIPSCFNGAGGGFECFYTQRRTVVLSAKYRF
ncbi:TonB-dependent siderophore receptor [Comamonadaceae bacterium OH2545_COT-014]|nr:TonB-dependent siderophore receptor [Comamonadaceae bacterium OH2545_COT-014]